VSDAGAAAGDQDELACEVEGCFEHGRLAKEKIKPLYIYQVLLVREESVIEGEQLGQINPSPHSMAFVSLQLWHLAGK
jgi:hypothetical protein